jgi:hypothetical protein
MDNCSLREIATILYALRAYQAICDRMEPPFDQEHFADWEPLTVEEVDILCERINFGKTEP